MARPMARVKIKGLATAAKKIEAMAKEAGEAVPSGMRVIGESVMTDVKASRPGAGVPRDKGVLAGSGRVSGGSKAEPAVTLTFGGAAAPYALRQHEDMTLNHPLGEARYLVRGLERFGPGQTQKVVEQMAAAVVAAGKAG